MTEQETTQEPTVSERLVYGDFTSFADENLFIITMEGQKVKFVLNEIQLILLDIIKHIKDSGRLVRLIILKARREGVSTFFCGRFFWFSVTSKNTFAMIVTHERAATDTLFNMQKRFLAHMDPEWRPDQKYNNMKLLEFNDRAGTGFDSSIRVGTAAKDDFGSAQLIHRLHVSELAKWPSAVQEPLLISLLQCVPKHDETEVVFESTAKGIGGEFYKRFWAARHIYEVVIGKDGKPTFNYRVNKEVSEHNQYNRIFIPWFVFEKYKMPVPEDFVPTKEEQEMKGLYNLTPEHFQWRRFTIENECLGKEDMFKQEYPSNAREAFLATGINVFDVMLISKLLEPETTRLPEPVARYECALTTGQWVHMKEGRLIVYEEPIPDRWYIIGADTAEGLSTGDFSCADVIDWVTNKQVAQWHGHIAPDLFGKILYHLGMRYNIAWVVPERQNHGHVVVDRLYLGFGMFGKYKNLWEQRINEAPYYGRPKYGWDTNSRNVKIGMVDEFAAVFRGDPHCIRNRETLMEMLAFKQKDDGSLEAEEGFHDDRVISASIAYKAKSIMQMPSYPPVPDEPQREIREGRKRLGL